MASQALRRGTLADAFAITECTNKAFLADAFFKKPEYHLRFTEDEVRGFIQRENTAFLVMEAAKEPLPALVGTLLLQWSVLSGASGIGNITGTFSAVSVPPEFERKGIGKRLVKEAEDELFRIAKNAGLATGSAVVMEMGVINMREDLFPWYEKQDYKVIGDIRPNGEEIERIKLEEMDICCVLMRKELGKLV